MLNKALLPLALGLLMAATAASAQDQQPAPASENAAPAQNGGEHRGPPSAENVIARLDTDKDGVISKTEAAASERMAGRFDTIDTDHDGKLTAAELTAFFATMHRPQQ
jgi:hypothetical protein